MNNSKLNNTSDSRCLHRNFYIPAYIATNASTNIVNVYDHKPQRLPGDDFAGNIILTLGMYDKERKNTIDRYYSTIGMDYPKPGAEPVKIKLNIELI